MTDEQLAPGYAGSDIYIVLSSLSRVVSINLLSETPSCMAFSQACL